MNKLDDLYKHVDPVDGFANPCPETDVEKQGSKIKVDGVVQFYELKDGRYAGMYHYEQNGSKPAESLEAPDGFEIAIEYLTYHPATGIECWMDPTPWVMLWHK